MTTRLVTLAAAIAVLLLATAPAPRANITAGTISGVTATFGSGGEVTLNDNGITFAAGTADRNKVKWNDGNAIFSRYLTGMGDTLQVVADSIELDGNLYLSGVSSSTFSASPLVWTPNQVTYKTDGVNATICGFGVSELAIEGGIVTGYSCSDPAPEATSAKLRDEVDDLRRQVAELRATVDALAGR